MKKIFSQVVASMLITYVVCAEESQNEVGMLSAAEPPKQQTLSTAATPPCERPHHLDVGGSYTYAWVKAGDNPTTHGSLGGTRFLYEYCPMNCVYTGLAFDWREGKTVHESFSSRSIQEYDVQSRIGYTFYFSQHKIQTTLFSGLGWHYMPETVKLGSASVEFKYTQFYVPVGLSVEKEFFSFFSSGFRFQWMPQIFSVVRIVPLSGAEWSLDAHLNNFSVDFPLKFSTCSGFFSVTFAPFFEVWYDGKSTAATTLGFDGPTGASLDLPGNRYLFTGFNVDLRFVF
ncbi:MAG: hypothetical protein RLZZ453_510 [Chlamydiota bacterium]|jgi:hypothetical protein